ncbi:LysR substrate-binding domain-containing protein [Nitratireductor sp. StC3]|uniref:LysR substrate-binding domain-containing protein n=1 Tax=Nitratireductor sp. StC3 TaxID=2126741 RepID=UPI000D0DD411|nr:LysR substrate-binding domain-containing protein [Nitratireductor sp. StC3]PSM16698.1 LysR family transcriptional regulator [Nitratireductor sp. StC3]
MNRHRANMRALEIFEAVSRHESIHGAAAELGVTQSAVSHQIRKLSEVVGERVVVRSGRGIMLTPAGRRLAAKLQVAFTQIERSLAEVVGTDRDVLRLAICSSFAPGWLIGRLGSFFAAHPEIDLQLRMYAQDPELTDAVADAFVTTLPTERGFWAMQLQAEKLIAVAPAPESRFASQSLPLVTTTLDPLRLGDDWIAWSRIAGVALTDIHTGRWLQTSHYLLALEMAKNGLGMALVPDFLAARDIEAGRLRALSPARLPTEEDYYLCIKAARRDETALRAFEAWFRRQIAETGGS